MRVIAFALALATAAVTVDAALTYNITQATQPGEVAKYRCLTTEKWLTFLPECLQQPTLIANSHDGCGYDDFPCHCINYLPYADIIEPLVFPPSLGGTGTCTLAELGAVRVTVTDMCNFFNYTQFVYYSTCPQLTPLADITRTTLTVLSEPKVVTH